MRSIRDQPLAPKRSTQITERCLPSVLPGGSSSSRFTGYAVFRHSLARGPGRNGRRRAKCLVSVLYRGLNAPVIRVSRHGPAPNCGPRPVLLERRNRGNGHRAVPSMSHGYHGESRRERSRAVRGSGRRDRRSRGLRSAASCPHDRSQSGRARAVAARRTTLPSVPGRLQGALPDLWRGAQRGCLQLPARCRCTLGRAADRTRYGQLIRHSILNTH